MRWGGGNFFFNTDDRRLRVEGEGLIRFRPDESDVEWMEDGAFFEVDDRQGGERRRLSLDGRGDAGIDRRYWLDGDEREIDGDARVWFSDALGQFFDRSGLMAESRVDRWVDEGGIDRALEEMEDVGNWTLNRYAVALLQHAESAEERGRVIEEIVDRVDSDFQRGHLLHAVQDDFFEDEASTKLWVELTEEIGSDFERARALGTVVHVPNATAPVLAMSLRAADEMDSDFEKSRLLVGVADLDDLDEEVMVVALEAADEMDSDFEKARALIALIPHLDGNESLIDRFYEVADEMDSDFEYARVMRALRRAEID